MSDQAEPWDAAEVAPRRTAPVRRNAIAEGTHAGVRWWVAQVEGAADFEVQAYGSDGVAICEAWSFWTAGRIAEAVDRELARLATKARKEAA